MKKIFLIFTLQALLFAYTFSELKTEPKSLAKDFYLYNLLVNDEIKPEQLAEFRRHIYRFAGKMQKEFEKRYQEESLPQSKDECFSFDPQSIVKAGEVCQHKRLKNIYFAKKIDAKNLHKFSQIFSKNDKNLSNLLRHLSQKNPIRSAIAAGDARSFFALKNAGFKVDDFYASKKFLKDFAKQKEAYAFLNSALVENEFSKFRHRLSQILLKDAKGDLAFAMGLNALIFGKNHNAKEYFLQAERSYAFLRQKDNALFFAYLASKNQKYLHKLANSVDLNIYSLYAKELTKTPLPKIIIPSSKKWVDFDVSDALLQARWQKSINKMSKKELEKELEKFDAYNSPGHYLVLYQKLHGYSDAIYPLAFYEYLKDYPKSQQALILAIAMQESKFLPASVSVSYALGMMQFMPFVARATAKSDFKIDDFDVTQMFNPQTAYKFANAHINLLKKSLESPLFIAYAYNGGLGFTKRMSKKDFMFSKSGKLAKYEPFLSMELVPYLESRLYGKKVLANYYVYSHILGEKITMKELFSQAYGEKERLHK